MATDPERGSVDNGVLIRMFKEHGPQVRRTLIRCTGNADDADDILQQAYFQIKRSGNLSPLQNEGAYLHTVAINIFNRLYRKRRRENTVITYDSELAEQHSEDVECEPELEEASDKRALEAATARLPARQRAALALQLRGFTYEEIAQKLNTSAPAVGQLVFSARRKLETMLKVPGQGKEKP